MSPIVSIKRVGLAALLLLVSAVAFASPESKTKWTARLEQSDVRAGESAQIVLSATLDTGWHMYALDSPADATIPTTIRLAAATKLIKVNSKITQPAPIIHHDTNFNADLRYFSGAVAYGIPINVVANAKGEVKAVVEVKIQTCNDSICLPPESISVPVTFKVSSGPARTDRKAAITTVPKQPAGYIKPDAKPVTSVKKQDAIGSVAATSSNETENEINIAKRKGLLSFLWLSMLAGFAALLTPCVFPMIPITVSFFSKRKSNDGANPVAGPIAYCLGIISTFTGVGLLFAVVFGATKIQTFAAHPITNLLLGILFVVLAANLFGAYEIILPSSLVNKANAGTRKGGLVGPYLMGVTFTLTSFTCTVGFVGYLLVSASQGGLFYPIVGMLGFSSAFALPFFLLALFPQYLSQMPKSGQWLVSVKAFMGFLELAAALKFLSNADLSLQKGLLTRPVFLAIWAAIFAVAAIYLLGWLRMPHDDTDQKIGIPRRLLAVGTAVVAFWFLGAMNGQSLGTLEAFPPPDPYPGQHTVNAKIKWLTNYEDAVARAKSENKAIFINFTGVTCVNCREMEKNVLPLPEVVSGIEKFVPVELYTDRPNPEDQKNQQLLLKLANTTANPVYLVIDANGRVIKSVAGRHDPVLFAKFLKEAYAGSQQTASR